jgi:peptidoglycan/xylan/chitin deacetylase (PgdA/CDA1 family)
MSRSSSARPARNVGFAGGAVLLLLAAGTVSPQTRGPGPDPCRVFTCDHGGIIRGDVSSKRIALILTGGSFADGGEHIRAVLKKKGIRAGFFFTGDFYRTPEFQDLIRGLAADGHYLGPHSDKHLLYCDWNDRGKTLVTRDEFRNDLLANYREMERFGIPRDRAVYFIPPYEWYNADIVRWAREMGIVLFNFTPGTSSNADYTTPSMREYLSSEVIYDRILAYEKKDPHGFNGFILLIHIGTDPERTDKLYGKLQDLITELERMGYSFVRIDELLIFSSATRRGP